jgi:hypothetical protein
MMVSEQIEGHTNPSEGSPKKQLHENIVESEGTSQQHEKNKKVSEERGRKLRKQEQCRYYPRATVE